jgi:hypothetical protein
VFATGDALNTKSSTWQCSTNLRRCLTRRTSLFALPQFSAPHQWRAQIPNFTGRLSSRHPNTKWRRTDLLRQTRSGRRETVTSDAIGMTRRVRNSSPRALSTILIERIADDPVKVAILDAQAAGPRAGCLLNQSISVILCCQTPACLPLFGRTARLLGPCRHRPRRCRCAEECDEIAPSHRCPQGSGQDREKKPANHITPRQGVM